MSVHHDKARIRELALRARLELAVAVRTERSARACERLVQLPDVVRARTVAFYAAIGSEADPSVAVEACRAAGKRVLYPRVASGRRLEFAPASPDELVPGAHRTRHPPGSRPAVPLAEVDCIVVPGVAFDAAGRRLGRGGGFYDATLAAVAPSTARIGFAFEEQIVDSIPSEAHDVAMDAVVTDARVLLAATAAAAASH